MTTHLIRSSDDDGINFTVDAYWKVDRYDPPELVIGAVSLVSVVVMGVTIEAKQLTAEQEKELIGLIKERIADDEELQERIGWQDQTL